jgi:hypothetical protein
MKLVKYCSTFAFAAALLCGTALRADDAKPAKDKETAAFGTLESLPADEAKAKALEWFKAAGKTDAESLKAFEAVWAVEDRPLLQKVAMTFALGDADAKKLLDEAADPAAPAPLTVPAILKDAKKSAFFRANLTLAYAKALSNRRVHEEALDALKLVKPEQVVDPGAYLFTKAVCEHSLLLKDDASRTIVRLLDDVVDAPERYRMVAALMHLDMLTWQEKDLGWVARMMNNIERRLDLARGGPKTQDMEKKVVVQLDEMIKKLEEEQQQQGQGQGQGKGKGKNGKMPGNTNQPSSPQQDSYGGNNSGPGETEMKKWKDLAQNWGNLPEKERAKAMQELTQNMPAKHRELIENYFKNLQKAQSAAPGGQ